MNQKTKPWWIYVQALFNYVDWLYTHSIDAAMLSMIMAVELNFNDDELYNIGLGALLHDVADYFKRVIVTRDTDVRISGISDLEGLTVAVQRNSSHHSYLLSYPKINLSLYDSVEAALTSIVTGSEKVFVGNPATTNYIRSNSLTNLRFVSFEAVKQQALNFAVRND